MRYIHAVYVHFYARGSVSKYGKEGKKAFGLTGFNARLQQQSAERSFGERKRNNPTTKRAIDTPGNRLESKQLMCRHA